jgi:uncharacterized protein YjbI with pentapeptide repeats
VSGRATRRARGPARRAAALAERVDVERPVNANAVFAASTELEEHQLGPSALEARLEQVGRVIVDAAHAGATTWDLAERSELRRIILHWHSWLQAQGEDVELPDLERFSGELPPLDEVPLDEIVAAAHAGQPIVACRIEDADLHGLQGVPNLRIIDCALSGCDLSGLELPDARLLHTTFIDCDLTGIRLPRLVATSSLFADGSLEGARATGASFSGTRFDAISLRGAELVAASFASTRLREVRADGAELGDALFDLATLEEVRLDGAELQRTIFTGATVRSSSFAGANLERSIFSSSDVRGSSFLGAQLTGASFHKAVDVAFATFDADAAESAEFNPADVERLRAGRPAATA